MKATMNDIAEMLENNNPHGAINRLNKDIFPKVGEFKNQLMLVPSFTSKIGGEFHPNEYISRADLDNRQKDLKSRKSLLDELDEDEAEAYLSATPLSDKDIKEVRFLQKWRSEQPEEIQDVINQFIADQRGDIKDAFDMVKEFQIQQAGVSVSGR